VPVARFWIAALLFHAVMLLVSLRIGRAWLARLREPVPAFTWMRALLRHAALFGGVMLLAGLPAVIAPKPAFTLMRFVCQGLFGEGVLLALWLTFVHMERGLILRAAAPGLLAAVLVGAYAEAYHREPLDLQVRHHVVDLTRGAAQAHRLRILHISDIQTPSVGAYEERAIREGLAQKPDLVVLTGDYVHERLRPTRRRATADLRELFRRLCAGAPLGMVAVRGDTDSDWPQVFDGLDVRLLMNDSASIALPGGGTLGLVGVAPRLSHGRDPARTLQVVESAPPADLVIAIGHAPDFVMPLAGQARVDLVLAGHTHGGQVALPFLGPPWISSRLPRRFAGDVHDYHGIPVHVSRGVGMERGTAPQIRFLCPPEICVIDVRYALRGESAPTVAQLSR
jgi:predicted MPP superfamily phosphohydrolase